MKIRVVLADDEPLIIKGLRKLIQWDHLGIEIVAQAYDGRELLEVIDEFKPDIVISDISMPHLTGIDIIKEINSRKLAIKTIFISAFQEFSYARDAVAFGAVDYLVKPINKQQLENVLARAVSMIKEENEEEKRRNKLQLFERKRQDEQMQDWLVRLTDQGLPPHSEAFRQLGDQLKGPLYTIGIVELDRIDNESDRWPAQEKKLIDFAIENILHEVVFLSGMGHVFFRNHSHVFLIEHAEPYEALQLAEDIKKKIKSFLKLSVSLGISSPVQSITGLTEAYTQAEQALQMKYFIGLNKVITYENPKPVQAMDNELYSYQQEIIRGLTSSALLDAKEGLNKLLAAIKAAAFGNPQLAVSTGFSSLLFIMQQIKKSGVHMADGSFDIHDLQSKLGEYETFADMEQGITAIVEELYLRLDDKAGNKEKLLLAKIKQYIEEHYNEEITLESVAAIAFMNPYYFSSFFKKHTNQNFKQYVTEVRMNQAIRLLSSTDYMVYEIAERVGYNNARHFSDMFKKIYGKLPNEYKQELKK